MIVGLAFGWSYPAIGALAGAELLLLAVPLFRYSRVIWLHMDQHFDPRP